MTDNAEPEWDAFVDAHPEASFFHRAAWRHVAPRVFGHRPYFLTAAKPDGSLGAVLPLIEVRSRLFGHALISTAFCVGGGPLAVDDVSRDAVLAEAEALARRLGVDYVELRDATLARSGWRSRDDLYSGFEGPIAASESDNLTQIPRKQRAVVRKALEAEFTTTVDRSTRHFYGLYADTMRNHGTPALPRRYFETLLAVFGPECEILTVHHKNTPISSVLSFYFRDRVMPYYTGSRSEARARGSNDLMYWSVMRRAVERGCSVFDFGRSKIGTGPHSFKRNWGFEPRPIQHQYLLVKSEDLPNVNPTNPHYALLIQAWRRLPTPVANVISPLLSRSLA